MCLLVMKEGWGHRSPIDTTATYELKSQRAIPPAEVIYNMFHIVAKCRCEVIGYHRDTKLAPPTNTAGVFSASSPFATADATRDALNSTNSDGAYPNFCAARSTK